MTTRITVTHPVTGEELPAFLPLSHAAKLLGKSEKVVRRMCENGSLPALPHAHLQTWSVATAALLRGLGFLPGATEFTAPIRRTPRAPSGGGQRADETQASNAPATFSHQQPTERGSQT